MPALGGPPAPAAPGAVDVARGLLGRLNAGHAGEDDVPRHAAALATTAEEAAIGCRHDAAAGWWSLDVRAAGRPPRCAAKLTCEPDGRWRLWVESAVAAGAPSIPPCASAVELVRALRDASADDAAAVAETVAARTGSRVTLAAGRLTVTAADGRRCRGLVAAGADGRPALFLLDGDAWAGAASHVERAGGLEARRP
jgi:hypothetical protein